MYRSQGDGTMQDEVRIVASGAQAGVAITGNDSTDLAKTTKGIYIGTSGDLRVTLKKDSTPVTFTGLSAGIIHPIEAKRIWVTGTTATGILGLS